MASTRRRCWSISAGCRSSSSSRSRSRARRSVPGSRWRGSQRMEKSRPCCRPSPRPRRRWRVPGHRAVATLGGNLCLDTRCVFYNQSEWWRRSNEYCLKQGGDTCHVAPQGRHCHAAFSGDLAPALIVLEADVEIVGPRGVRRLPLADLYVDDGAAPLALGAGRDSSRRVRVPAQPARARARIPEGACPWRDRFSACGRGGAHRDARRAHRRASRRR